MFPLTNSLDLFRLKRTDRREASVRQDSSKRRIVPSPLHPLTPHERLTTWRLADQLVDLPLDHRIDIRNLGECAVSQNLCTGANPMCARGLVRLSYGYGSQETGELSE
jgi:hypothetical protein